MKRNVAISLMAIGTALVLMAVALLGYNLYESRQAGDYADDILQAIHRNVVDTDEDDADPFDEEMAAATIDGYDYIGYLSIPTLELDLPVMSTCDYSRLRLSPCRYYGSVKTDNLVIAAHNYRHHFGYLGQLQAGDPVSFTAMDATTYRYRVTAIETLAPTATDRVKDAGDDLILYTCTYSGSKRIVIRCSYI